LPPGVTAYDVGLSTVDAHLKYQGLSVLVDYYWRYITQFSGGSVPSLFDHGFVLQAGYFVVPRKLEALGRWSRIVGDSGSLGLEEESTDEVAGGVAWYFEGHAAKIVTQATYRNGGPLTDGRLDIVAGDLGWLFQTQLQLAF
jgi:hypothetical protein